MKRTRCSWAARVTVTLNSHVACRFSPSVAVQLTVVCPIGNVVPDPGEQLTFTGLWPSRASGVGYDSAMPSGLIVLRVMPSSHDSVGAAGGGGGGGGGGGDGALGLLQPDPIAATKSVQNSKRRIITDAQDCINKALHVISRIGARLYLEENS
jgi:hypothetical protein